MASRNRVRFKASDIWDAPDDDRRYEVIDGELFMSPAPAWRHQVALGNLYGHIWSFVRPRKLGFVVTAPVGVVLDEENGVQPDLIFISHAHASIISRRGVEGAPDLVVEVLSPSTQARDRGIKLRRYAAAGVLHYWILDLDAPALEVYVLGVDGYALTGTYGPGSTFRPSLFPGLAIPMDEILAA